MTQDLQQLLEKINTEGVEKANIEAAKIIDQATLQAKALVDAATREATKKVATAKQESDAFERRAEETIRQAARDTLLNVEKALTDMLCALLLKEVKTTMNTPALVSQLASEAVRAYITGKGGVDVATSAALADALRATLATEAANGVTVVTDTLIGSGFKVRLANGRIEHDFSGGAVADALAKNLRPKLAALLKGQPRK
jgi:V/A-type H+/Na+-transporting ATPase subunit E